MLRLIAFWWQQGGAAIQPDAQLGPTDTPIRQLVEDATGIRRE